MAFSERNLSSGEAAFVSTWTLWSAEDSLEEMLAPGFIPSAGNRYVFELRDRIDLCDKDCRSCLARVAGFTHEGSPILRAYDHVVIPVHLPETQPAEPGTGRRRAA